MYKRQNENYNNYPSDSFAFLQYFQIQIKEVSQRRENFLNRTFTIYHEFEYLLDIIYGYRIGVEISSLKKNIFNKKVTDIDRDVEILCEENIVRKDGVRLFPWHDIYLEEYLLYRGYQKIYSKSFSSFLEKMIKSSQDNISYLISLILKCSNSGEYLELAMDIRDHHYRLTEFGTALNISLSIVSNLENSNHSNLIELLEAKFKYADCLNHCGSIIDSRRIFSQIYNQAWNVNANIELRAMALEAKGEYFNITFWLLEIKDKLNELYGFIERLENSFIDFGKNKRFINAYLTSNNRLMVSLLLLDKYREARNLLDFNINKAKDCLLYTSPSPRDA